VSTGDATVVEALVQIGAVVVPCVRAGRGSTVLVLGAGPLDRLAESPVFRQLSRASRAIGAVPPAGCEWTWLRDLIDGLGIERTKVVADRTLAELVQRFADECPDRLEGVVCMGEPSEAAD
jgi:hypothetical protein